MANRNSDLFLGPEKKSTARARHKSVASKYQEWLEENPKASAERKAKTFDAFCDSAILDQELKSLTRKKKSAA
jgi:hypothetical protein